MSKWNRFSFDRILNLTRVKNYSCITIPDQIRNAVNTVVCVYNQAMYHKPQWDGYVLAGYLHPMLVKLNYILQRISKTIVTVPYKRLLFVLLWHSISSLFAYLFQPLKSYASKKDIKTALEFTNHRLPWTEDGEPYG